MVVRAQEGSREFKHPYIGTEHLLVGLVDEMEGLGARVLTSLGVTQESVRESIAKEIGVGTDETLGQIPFTPRAKKVLEFSLREALSLGHNYIGTEHILLSLVGSREGGKAIDILRTHPALSDDELGAALADRVRAETMRLLGPPKGAPAEAPFRYRRQYLAIIEVTEAGEPDAERLQRAVREAVEWGPSERPFVKLVHIDDATPLRLRRSNPRRSNPR